MRSLLILGLSLFAISAVASVDSGTQMTDINASYQTPANSGEFETAHYSPYPHYHPYPQYYQPWGWTCRTYSLWCRVPAAPIGTACWCSFNGWVEWGVVGY